MDDLEFRKFLTTYGISYEEYEGMADKKKQELIDKFNREMKSDNLNKIGQGLQGLGCLIMLIPILLILLFFLFSFIRGIF